MEKRNPIAHGNAVLESKHTTTTKKKMDLTISLYLTGGVCLFYLQAFLLKRVWPVPIRYFNSFCLWLSILLLASWAFLVLLVPYFTLRFVSERMYLIVGSAVQRWYLHLFLMMIYEFMEVRITVYGDRLDTNTANLWIPNHITHDWLFIYPMNAIWGTTGNERVVIKKSMSYLPFLGWGMTMLYWPFLARDYKHDVKVLKLLFGAYKTAALPLQVYLFTEGTRITPKNIEASQKVAREKGLRVWDHVMLPRHRGFCIAADSLHGVATNICDTTIAYDGFKDNRHAPFSEFIFYDHDKPHTVHIHMKKVPLAVLPPDEDGRKEWLINSFQAKEERMNFYWKNMRFPEPAIHDETHKTRHWTYIIGSAVYIVIVCMTMPLIVTQAHKQIEGWMA